MGDRMSRSYAPLAYGLIAWASCVLACVALSELATAVRQAHQAEAFANTAVVLLVAGGFVSPVVGLALVANWVLGGIRTGRDGHSPSHRDRVPPEIDQRK
jgi:hypothetical protein